MKNGQSGTKHLSVEASAPLVPSPSHEVTHALLSITAREVHNSGAQANRHHAHANVSVQRLYFNVQMRSNYCLYCVYNRHLTRLSRGRAKILRNEEENR